MSLKGIGHELLTIIVRYALILVSTLDPDAPAQRVPGLRLSIPGESYKWQRPKCFRIWVGRFVLSPGIEPGSQEPQSCVLSIKL